MLGLVLLAAAGCNGGSGQTGGAFTFLSVDSISPGGGVTSSLQDRNASTLACVTLRNTLKNPTVTLPTALDSVFIQFYTVVLIRADGGPAPGAFTVNTAVTVPSGSVTNGGIGGNTAQVPVIVVPADAKNNPPLRPSPAVPLSASALVTFKGKDGRGQSVQVDAGIPVLFVGSGTDVGNSCAGTSGSTGGSTGGTTGGTTGSTTSGSTGGSTGATTGGTTGSATTTGA